MQQSQDRCFCFHACMEGMAYKPPKPCGTLHSTKVAREAVDYQVGSPTPRRLVARLPPGAREIWSSCCHFNCCHLVSPCGRTNSRACSRFHYCGVREDASVLPCEVNWPESVISATRQAYFTQLLSLFYLLAQWLEQLSRYLVYRHCSPKEFETTSVSHGSALRNMISTSHF